MLQTPEVAAARIQNWFKKHPAIAETDANIACLTKYIADHFSVAGETIIDEAYLDLAYQTIGSTLQHIAGPEVQAEIQRAQQQAQAAQQQLAAEKAEKDRQARELRKRIERQARQDAHFPGVSSAYSEQDSDVKQQQRDAQDAQKAIQREILHRQFVAELHEIEIHQEYAPGGGAVNWAKTFDSRRAKKLALKLKYPAFASEIKIE